MTRVPLPPDTDPLLSYTPGERAQAGWAKNTVEQDTFGYSGRVRRDVLREMLDALPADQVTPEMGAIRAPYPTLPEGITAERALFKALDAAQLDAAGPVNVPLTAEALDQEVDRRRKAEWDEANAVFGLEGPGLAGFAGGMARSVVDPLNLALLPLGAGPGSLLRTMAIEGALNAGAEAFSVVARERGVAEDLGLPEPDLAARTAEGFLFGAGITGVVGGAARAVGYVHARRRAAVDTTPPGMNSLDHEADIATAEAALDADPAQPPRPRDPNAPPLQMADFDFGRGGNASPYSNTIGYVFGRLLELGYQPHVAAGAVGNMMQESGPGRLDTRASGDGGNSFGMVQWNGPRMRAYMAFAGSRGADPADIDTQIAFWHHEMQTTHRHALDAVRSASDVNEATLILSRDFWAPGDPRNENRLRYANEIWSQYQSGQVPRWRGSAAPIDTPSDAYRGPTSRGYTGSGQVTAGDGIRIDVDYEVVDAAMLTPASGELQPRDRSRAASDEQIAEIAARLDPARLMPSPEADRGAPVVGPDNVIESGNGRVMAIRRAAEMHPDRMLAYREAIEAAGFTVPDGVETPVLIARRTTRLTPEERQDLVRAANTSAVARMSSTERSAADAKSLGDETVRLYVPGEALAGPANRPFVKQALASLPQAERAALVTADGALNAEGVTRLQQALFARAYGAPDIIARATETGAGELRSLIEALDAAAPAWAALRADIEAGAVRPEFDITPFVLDAVRLIAEARQLARSQGGSVAKLLDELLAGIDLFEGQISPLTVALVRKFAPGGKAAKAEDIAAFLNRYAAEARKIGGTEPGLFGDAPGPLDALKAIDREAFGELAEIGRPAGTAQDAAAEPLGTPLAPEAYADGALSPEAEMAVRRGADALRAEIAGEPFGPVFRDLRDQPEAAIERLMAEKTGEVPDAFVHPELGDVAFVYGNDRMGLRHIEKDHPGDLARVPEVLRKGRIVSRTAERVRIAVDPDSPMQAVIRLDWDGQEKTWLVTAFTVDEPAKAEVIARQLRTSDVQTASASTHPEATGHIQDGRSAGAGQETGDTRQPRTTDVQTASAPTAPEATGRAESAAGGDAGQDAIATELARLREDLVDFEFTDERNVTWRASEYLDDLDADRELDAVIDACTLGGRA